MSKLDEYIGSLRLDDLRDLRNHLKSIAQALDEDFQHVRNLDLNWDRISVTRNGTKLLVKKIEENATSRFLDTE